MSRKYAWSLLLGLNHNLVQQSYKDLYTGLRSEIFSIEKSSLNDLKVQK